VIAAAWAVVGLVVGVLVLESVAGRLALPAPVLVVLGGVGASLIPWVPDYAVEPELVLVVLLPPLLYAAALDSSALAIRVLWRPVVGLAVGLVIATTLAVGFVLNFLVPAVPLPAAVALGAIVAPPDAVAATAIARRLGLSRRVTTVLEGESLFDDAAALVLLRVSIAGIAAGTVEWVPAAGEFAWATVGGLAIGAAVGYAISWGRRALADIMPITALSLCAPFVAFLVAEEAHASGVLAVVITGLVVGYRRSVDVSAQVRLNENATWGALRFLLEGIVFGLIGLQFLDIVGALDSSPSEVVLALVAVLGTVLLVRPIWLFAGYLVSHWVPVMHPRLSARETAVLSWAGMRGVVSLAAAQTLPADTPLRPLLLVCAVGVIFATLVVQGLTLPMVIRWVGAPRRDPAVAAQARHTAQERATASVLRTIARRVDADDLSEELAERIRELAELRAWRSARAMTRVRGSSWVAPAGAAAHHRAGARIAHRPAQAGQLSEHVMREMEIDLDLERRCSRATRTSAREGTSMSCGPAASRTRTCIRPGRCRRRTGVRDERALRVRRCRWGPVDVERQVVRAPPPVLARLERADDGMVGVGPPVGGGVAAGRGVTTSDVAACHAHAQVHPQLAGAQVVHAARPGGGDVGDGAEVRAGGGHPGSPGSLVRGRSRAARSQPARSAAAS